jgi:hypothetical protein
VSKCKRVPTTVIPFTGGLLAKYQLQALSQALALGCLYGLSSELSFI